MRIKFFLFSFLFPWSLLAQPSLPAIKFQTLPKERINSAPFSTPQELKGKVVLVDFWASWCEPCKEALPHYNKLYLKYKDQGLVVIGINEDDDIKERDAFLKTTSLAIPLYYDKDKSLIQDFKVQALPTLYVFDKNLKPVAFYRGYKTENSQALESQILKLLKSEPDQR